MPDSKPTTAQEICLTPQREGGIPQMSRSFFAWKDARKWLLEEFGYPARVLDGLPSDDQAACRMLADYLDRETDTHIWIDIDPSADVL